MDDPLHQGYGVLHRELGARPDAEMRRVRRIADEHDISVMPLRTQDAIEVQPCRTAQMLRVAHQSAAAQILAEETFAKRDRLIGGVCVESVRAPRLLAGLDDDRGNIVAELIGMNLKPAVLGLFECKGK